MIDFTKLGFGNPLAEDEHTANDGPYLRVLRARKWLYILAALATLHHYALIDYNVIRKLSSGLLGVDPWIVGNSLKFAIVVFWTQFVLLSVQLLIFYRPIIQTRLLANSANAFQREQEAIAALEANKRTIIDSASSIEKKMAATRRKISENIRYLRVLKREVVPKNRSERELLNGSSFSPDEDSIRGNIDELRSEFDDLTIRHADMKIAIRDVDQRLTSAQAKLESNIAGSPERNPLYWAAEVTIDGLRVGTPFVVATIAAGALLFMPPAPDRSASSHAPTAVKARSSESPQN